MADNALIDSLGPIQAGLWLGKQKDWSWVNSNANSILQQSCEAVSLFQEAITSLIHPQWSVTLAKSNSFLVNPNNCNRSKPPCWLPGCPGLYFSGVATWPRDTDKAFPAKRAQQFVSPNKLYCYRVGKLCGFTASSHIFCLTASDWLDCLFYGISWVTAGHM